MRKIAFSVAILAEIKLFQSLNHQEGNLKVRPLIKGGSNIVPKSSTTNIISVIWDIRTNILRTEVRGDFNIHGTKYF